MLRVKEICKEQGITIANLAHRLGVKPPALSRIINGGTTTTATLDKIAKALGVSIAELFEKPSSGEFTCPNCGANLAVDLRVVEK